MTELPVSFNPEFDPVEHIYRVGGKVLPSVTQVLADEGLSDYTWATPEAMRRGSWVHEQIAEITRTGFSETVVDEPDWLGYIEAWEQWKRETIEIPLHSEPALIETPLYSPTLYFAGTPDVVFDGVVVDYKTGAPRHTDGVQLAAYAMLLQFRYYDLDPHELKRVSVYLGSTGMFREIVRDDDDDFEVFESATRLWWWKDERQLHG